MTDSNRDEAAATRVEPAQPTPRVAFESRFANLAISMGAMLGVAARYGLTTLSQQHVPITFPVGTLLVNLIGCLLSGIAQTVFLERLAARREWQLFVSVGILGGFTTFSTFSVETIQLLTTGRVAQALLYQALSLVGGIAAVVAGVMVARFAYRRQLMRP